VTRPGHGTTRSDGLTSDGVRVSSNDLTAVAAATDEPDEIRAIWGTTVNLSETMKLFEDFLKGFKPKYRFKYDQEQGLNPRPITHQEGDVVLYESYLRRMRITGETNLNLDAVNLLAYGPAKKLYSQLIKYPQEVIPAMDQKLKDAMLDIAEADKNAHAEGMEGARGAEEIAEINARVYKIRPFGLPAINMRDLNPSGRLTAKQLNPQLITTYKHRHRQTGVYQGSGHPCYSRHP
jgi:DNA replication licensing factor MCM4